MAAKRGGLGKGLDSLISDKVNTKQLNTGMKQESEKKPEKPDMMVKITKVEPNRDQPRKNFDEKALSELAESIKQYGILQPLLVQDRKSYYEIVAGERRWRAAKMAGLKEVPVIIRNLSDQEIMEISLIENIQREDLDPIEEAKAYQKLIDEFKLKQTEVAKRVAKSRTAITNSMRLLKLAEEVQQMLSEGKISTGHARCLIALEDPKHQIAVAKQIVEESLSVRQTEALMKKIQKKPSARKKEELDPKNLVLYKEIEENLKTVLGTKVAICPKNNQKGKVEIEYYSQDDLDRIIQMIRK